MMNVEHTLPTGEKAFKLEIMYPTVNVETLDVVITVAAYDNVGNVCELIRVPYKLDTMRDIPVDEQERVVTDYLSGGAES